MSPQRAVRIVALSVGLFYVGFGMWAFLAPASYYERVVAFAPFNPLLVHNMGAFQAGIGVMLLLALVRADALLVVLAGTACAGILHLFSHIINRGLGQGVTDLPSLALLTLAVIVAALFRARPPPPDDDEGSA